MKRAPASVELPLVIQLRRHVAAPERAYAGARPTVIPTNPTPIPGTPPGPCSEPQPYWPNIDGRAHPTLQGHLALAC